MDSCVHARGTFTRGQKFTDGTHEDFIDHLDMGHVKTTWTNEGAGG